jgi:hypothetical protein
MHFLKNGENELQGGFVPLGQIKYSSAHIAQSLNRVLVPNLRIKQFVSGLATLMVPVK